MNDYGRGEWLAAIAECPDDNDLRCVYADWLQDGRARDTGSPLEVEYQYADLIRSSVEMAAFTQRGNPNCETTPVAIKSCFLFLRAMDRDEKHWCASCQRIAKLQAAQRELLAWAADQLIPSPWIGDCVWDRGLVTHVTTRSQYLHNAAWAWGWHPIHTVQLTDWKGIEESLPPTPREAMPTLKRLLLPRSHRLVIGSPSIGRVEGFLDRAVNPWHPDISMTLQDSIQSAIPGVEIGTWGSAPERIELAHSDFEDATELLRRDVLRGLSVPEHLIR